MLSLREPDRRGSAAQAVVPFTEVDDAGPPDEHEGWPGEVRDLLRHANEQARALRAERRALLDRVGSLEKRLRAATAESSRLAARLHDVERTERERERERERSPVTTNEEWLAGVADRSAHALRSSQEVARGLVERARQRAGEIEQAALHDAAEIRKRAEADAQRILTVANYDAEGLLQGAQASSEELLAEARKVRDRTVAKFAERRAALQAEIDRLESRRVGLLETYAAMKPIVDEAIEILEGHPAGGGQRPRAEASVRGRSLVGGGAEPPQTDRVARPVDRGGPEPAPPAFP